MQSESSTAVVDFIEKNLIGRTLSSAPITAVTNVGATEVTYVDETFFSNLVRRQLGFNFDLTVITIGRRFGLSNGDRAALAGTMDAVRVYRYEMTERVSTGKLLGFARHISSTNTQFDPVAGTCFMVQMRVENGALISEEQQIGYGDFPAVGGRRRAQALDSIYRYSLDSEGALRLKFDQATYDVDPDSFARVPTGDTFPTQLSQEQIDREGEPIRQ